LPGATPFARTGPMIVVLPAAALALCALLLEARRRRGAAEVTKPQKAART
jgi:hypothetical protein